MADTAQGAPDKSKGLLASLGGLAATLVAIAHTRLDMLAVDLAEGRDYLLSLVVTALAALFCFGVGLVLASIFLVVVFWDTHRLLVLGSLTGIFLAAGLIALMSVMNKLKAKPALFSGSLAELVKDRQHLAVDA